MAINFETVRNLFVELAKAKIGAELSTLPKSSGTTPAVVKARKDLPPKPAFPYCVLDIQAMMHDPNDYEGMFVTENGFPGYYSRTSILFSFTVYGGDAISIINPLWKCFRQSSVKNLFKERGVGAITEIENVVVSNRQIPNDWVDIAAFNVHITVMDFHEATDEPMIGTVIIDNTIKDNFDIQEFIAQITVTET